MVEYHVNGLLFFWTEITNIIAIFSETNNTIISICPKSFLWPLLIISIFVHFFAYSIANLDTKIALKIINVIIFFVTCVLILSQLCTKCNGDLTQTYTYIASICNIIVFAWYFCVNVYHIILQYCLNTQPTSHAIIVDPYYVNMQYGAINQNSNQNSNV